jgi:uncharacterized protein YkwD
MRPLIPTILAITIALFSCSEDETRCRAGTVPGPGGECMVPLNGANSGPDADAGDDSNADADLSDTDDPNQTDPNQTIDPHDDPNVQGIITAMNQARSQDQDCRSEGQWSATGPIQGHELLHLAAQIHADDMADNDFFSHTGSDGSSFSQRIYDTGYTGSPMAENIAAGGTDPANIVERWLASDGHCRNLMMPTATEIGVGFTYGGNWGTLWVLKVARGS